MSGLSLLSSHNFPLTTVDRKAELKKLNRSILVCFLELLDILINNPSSPEVSVVLAVMQDSVTSYFVDNYCSATKRLMISVSSSLTCTISSTSTDPTRLLLSVQTCSICTLIKSMGMRLVYEVVYSTLLGCCLVLLHCGYYIVLWAGLPVFFCNH